MHVEPYAFNQSGSIDVDKQTNSSNQSLIASWVLVDSCGVRQVLVPTCKGRARVPDWMLYIDNMFITGSTILARWFEGDVHKILHEKLRWCNSDFVGQRPLLTEWRGPWSFRARVYKGSFEPVSITDVESVNTPLFERSTKRLNRSLSRWHLCHTCVLLGAALCRPMCVCSWVLPMCRFYCGYLIGRWWSELLLVYKESLINKTKVWAAWAARMCRLRW